MNVPKLTGLIPSIFKGAIAGSKKIVSVAADSITELSSGNPAGESLVRKRVLGLFDLDSLSLFNKKEMVRFEEISPDKLLLVHLTNYLPENGKIRTLFDMTGRPRNTLHFALNHAVVNPLGAGGEKGWTLSKYAIFTPFDKAASNKNLIGGKYNDFMFEGNFSLPEGSFIYRQNPDIEKGKVLFKDASDLLGSARGITLIEGSEPAYEMADVLTEKLGYTNLKKLHCEGMGSSIETVNLVNDINAMMEIAKKINSGELSEEEINKIFNIDLEAAIANVDKNLEFEANWNKVWADFATKINCSDTPHCATNYAVLEKALELLDLLSYKDSGWKFNDVDCRESLLNALNNILQSSDKKPSFVDIEKLKNIISSASTPKQAVLDIKSSADISDFFDDSTKIDDSTFAEIAKHLIEALKPKTADDFFEWNY